MTVNIGKTTTVVATFVAVAILVVVMFFFISTSNTETKTAAVASIGGFDDMIPTDSDSVVTSDGAISIFAPTGVSGHWETDDGEFFSSSPNVFFCPYPMANGVREYTFIPDDPTLPRSTVRAIIRGFAG